MPDAAEGRVSALPVLLATVGGIGHLRRAPGTWASLVAGGLALVVLPQVPPGHLTIVVIATAVAVSLLGFAVCPAAARHFRCGDPSQVVIDEVAGVWCALAVIPTVLLQEHLLPTVILAVAAFRVFDIAKPWPVGWLERLPGPASIMADDLAAGIIAGLVTTALLH